MKSLVIIPTYNEKENIENIIRKVISLDANFHVLIVDDGSPDGTAAIIQSLQKELQGKQNSELQRIRVIVEKAINKFAEDNDYDLILRADGTTLFAKKYVDITQEIINILN